MAGVPMILHRDHVLSFEAIPSYMILAFICALCVYSKRNERAVYIPGRQLSCYSCLSCLKIAELLLIFLSVFSQILYSTP